MKSKLPHQYNLFQRFRQLPEAWYNPGMTPRTFFVTLLQLGLAGVVLLLSHYNYTWIAVFLVLVPTAVTWFYGGRDRDAWLAGTPSAVVGLSVAVLIGLNHQPLGQPVFPVLAQLVLTILYAAWLIWLRQLRRRHQASIWALGLQQLAAISAIFLATAFWHWPQTLGMVLMWVVVFVTTLWYMRAVGERAAAILAAAWALVATELSWILSAWQVIYVQGSYLIVPQATVVILGVGYCFASIHASHTQKRLSRRRLIEYVAIAGVLLAIVITGTRWNGTS
jgi:hypothetical protein